MPWPQALEYNEAIQNPAVCFEDPDLRAAQPFVNALGMPTPCSGNFADVYRLDGENGSWAVKCFTREVPGLRERYQAVSDHLREHRRPFMVEFQYLDQGIRIHGEMYPVVKMRWVEGFNLTQFVADHVDDAFVLGKLAELWVRLARELRKAQMAHGDLQHGNVLLVAGRKANALALKLIDYDGLLVPALEKQPSGEAGHRNYQHPRRTARKDYGPGMDRFSLLLVHTALLCLAREGPGLWKEFDRGDNLLFSEADFAEPAQSPLLKKLWNNPAAEVRALAGRLLLAAVGPIDMVPTLDEIVKEQQPNLSAEEELKVSRLLGSTPPRPRQSPPPPTANRAINSPTPPPPRRTTPLPVNAPEKRAMPSKDSADLPPLTPDQRRAAAGQFERANQVIATGNYDYGLKLLLSCCIIDRANLIYRQALRRTEKAKYKNNQRGHWLAWLLTWPLKARLKAARHSGDHAKVLDLGENILLKNPWDVGTQMDMASAADELGLLDLAVWSLEQARQKDGAAVPVNRALALLYEKRGNFTQAMALWKQVLKAAPQAADAAQKLKDLAASETIQRGNYANAQDARDVQAEAPSPEASEPNAGRPTSEIRPRTSSAPSAGEMLRRRIESTPTDPKAYLQLAQFHRRADEMEQARAVLEEGLGPTGNAFELMVELAEMDMEPFRRDLAVTEDRLKADPDDPEMRKHRARLRKEINARELDLFRRKADRFPNDASLRLEVGIRLMRANQTEEAIHELQAMRGDNRHGGKAAYYLGHCFKARNNWRLAQRNFEEALQQLSTEETEMRKEALFALAQGHADAGDLAKAVDLASDLAYQDFSFRDIGKLLDEWQTKLARVKG